MQIENPDGTRSNVVSLVVAAPNVTNDAIALSRTSPAATGKDIVVVDPTTAGVSAQGNDVDLNVVALGLFSVTSNSCNLAGNSVPLQRPTSGNATFDLCIFSESGLDTSMTYTVSGPGDVTVTTKQPAGLGIIHLTLQIPASALLGGTLGHLHSHVDEVPAFQPGEEVYLFLWARDGEPYRALGWSQGTFRIARNALTGLETVTQDSAATPIFALQTHAFRRGGIRNLPVAIFREKLHKILRQQEQ